MNKSILVLVVFLFLFIPNVFATDVVYIVKNDIAIGANVISGLEELNLSFDIVDDSEINSINFDNYEMILLGDGNIENVPVSEHKSLIMNPNYYEDWSGSIGSSTSSAIFNLEHTITGRTALEFDAYNTRNIQIYYLTGAKYSTESVTVKANSTSGKGRYIIATKTEPRRVFYGITESNYWTEESKDLFLNSILWIFFGEDNDDDGFYSDLDCDDSDFDINPDATEIPYNGVDDDCSNGDLVDVDLDSFVSVLVGGDDCNDFDPEFNVDSEDPYKNCMNDAPTMNPIEKIVAEEAEEVIIIINATDFEGDELFFSINDSRFTQDSLIKNRFVWQTDYYDMGDYVFSLNVSDSEFNVTMEIEVEIENENQAPLCDDIPNIEWNEDENYTLWLADYCYDLDPSDSIEFFLYDSSDDNNIYLDFFNSQTGEVKFSPEKDWEGEDWITFAVFDGTQETITGEIILRVLNVNDAPTFEGIIENMTWEEDTVLYDHLNLYDYFVDIDIDDLVFDVIGNDFVGVNISQDGLVSFFSVKDWYGVEEIVFSATDGLSEEIYSNIIQINISDENEPPSFWELNCEKNILEDEGHECELNATDVEGDEPIFGIHDEINAICEIVDGNVLNYKGDEDFSGEATCVISLTDEYHDDSVTMSFSFNISEVNDAPVISDFSPQDNSLKIIELRNQLFSINGYDIDDEQVSISWFLDLVEVSSTPSYLFNQESGVYNLRAMVDDGELNDSVDWNIIVGDISEFTCSEVGGDVCTVDEICSFDYLAVYDSNVCCPTSCSEKPPEFSDAKTCSNEGINVNSSLKIDIRTPFNNENFKPGENVKVEVRVDNDFEEDSDFDIYVYLYDLTNDEEIESKKKRFEINSGYSESYEVEFVLDDDIDDNDYAIFASAIERNEDNCNDDYVEINVERKENEIVISELIIDSTKAYCMENIEINAKIENKGTKGHDDVRFVLENRLLGISEESEEFELDSFDRRRNSARESLIFRLPQDAEEGTYRIKATVYYDDNGESYTQNVNLIVGECRSTTINNETTQGEISLGDNLEKKEKKKSFFYKIISLFASLFNW